MTTQSENVTRQASSVHVLRIYMGTSLVLCVACQEDSGLSVCGLPRAHATFNAPWGLTLMLAQMTGHTWVIWG